MTGAGEELSGVTILLFIACGVLTFFLLFIFAKRQIMRFTLKSKHTPHVPVGYDIPKSLRREIDRRLFRVTEVQHEPRLLPVEAEARMADSRCNTIVPPYFYRMKAVDALGILEQELRLRRPTHGRHPGSSLRAFLATVMGGSPSPALHAKQVHAFCDMYDHARYHTKEFGPTEFKQFMDLLIELIQCLKTLKVRTNSVKENHENSFKERSKNNNDSNPDINESDDKVAKKNALNGQMTVVLTDSGSDPKRIEDAEPTETTV